MCPNVLRWGLLPGVCYTSALRAEYTQNLRDLLPPQSKITNVLPRLATYKR